MIGSLVVFLCLLLTPAPAVSSVLTSDTIWEGEIILYEDVLVPDGISLTIMPGTVIKVIPSESTRTDPEYISPLTELIVRGTLVVNGQEGSQVSFLPRGDKRFSWAGIILDGGRAMIRSATIRGAETGITVIKGSLSFVRSTLTGNRYGLTAHGRDAVVRLESSRVTENEYGVFLLNGARLQSKGTMIEKNSRKDRYSAAARRDAAPAEEPETGQKAAGRIFGDEVILGTVVWQKRIEVRGAVRVPEGSRLVILPGTLVEFAKRDTNRDGIGENGILIQGAIIAKGTKEEPIIFRSAEKQRRMGDWDSINIMNSDRHQNLIEHCRIEDAYRGLHFHFSNVMVTNSVLRNNYRGMQFQESVVEVRGTHFTGNKNGLQARDSEVLFAENTVYRNYSGMNVFRNSITIRGNSFLNNDQEGLKVRESLPIVEENRFENNRYGLMVNDTLYGSFVHNLISHNLEAGVSLKSTDTVELSGNAVQANGLSGMNIQDSNAVIRGNLISENGERGIGVLTFRGKIAGNNILKNGLYNLGIDGDEDISARENWWGGEDLKKTIFDKGDDPSRGRVELLPAREHPARFTWPLTDIRNDTAWHGDIMVRDRVIVEQGKTLTMSPGTRVLFAKGAGLTVKGRILARGEKRMPVTFASAAGTAAGEWDELMLDHAAESVFTNCSFRDATWALHSHFTDLTVDGCIFVNNYGGMRFTSGPLEVRRSFFAENVIGLRAFRAKAFIADNIITRNKIGIFVREKGGGLTITRNNIIANEDYGIRIGDFNDEDVDAKKNWWGGTSPAAFVFDARNEPGIGMVRFDPAAKHPFSLKIPFEVGREPGGAGRENEEGEKR